MINQLSTTSIRLSVYQPDTIQFIYGNRQNTLSSESALFSQDFRVDFFDNKSLCKNQYITLEKLPGVSFLYHVGGDIFKIEYQVSDGGSSRYHTKKGRLRLHCAITDTLLVIPKKGMLELDALKFSSPTNTALEVFPSLWLKRKNIFYMFFVNTENILSKRVLHTKDRLVFVEYTYTLNIHDGFDVTFFKGTPQHISKNYFALWGTPSCMAVQNMGLGITLNSLKDVLSLQHHQVPHDMVQVNGVFHKKPESHRNVFLDTLYSLGLSVIGSSDRASRGVPHLDGENDQQVSVLPIKRYLPLLYPLRSTSQLLQLYKKFGSSIILTFRLSSWRFSLKKQFRFLLQAHINHIYTCGMHTSSAQSISHLPLLFFNRSSSMWLYREVQIASLMPIFIIRNTFALFFRFPYYSSKKMIQGNRKSIERRYLLLAYYHNLLRETLQTGVPMVRSIWYQYPFLVCRSAAMTLAFQNQFLLGDNILCSPIFETFLIRKPIYFPPGTWYEFNTHLKIEGDAVRSIDVEPGYVPFFVKEGSVLVTQKVGRNSQATLKGDISIEIYPSKEKFTYKFIDPLTSSKFTVEAYEKQMSNNKKLYVNLRMDKFDKVIYIRIPPEYQEVIYEGQECLTNKIYLASENRLCLVSSFELPQSVSKRSMRFDLCFVTHDSIKK